MWWTATFECVADSTHWGQKGNTNKMKNIEGATRAEAIAAAKKQCPLNWRVTGIGEQSHRCNGDCWDGVHYTCDIYDLIIEPIDALPSLDGGWLCEDRWIEFGEEAPC